MKNDIGFERYIRKLIVVFVIFAVSGIFLFLIPNQSHLVLLIFSFFLMYYGWVWLRYYSSLKDWQRVDARILVILEKEIDEHENSIPTKYFYPEIEYEYTIENKLYVSNTVGHGIENYWVPEYDDSGWKNKNEVKFWNSWKKNTMIQIFVNPNNPRISVIVNKLKSNRKSHYLAIFVSGILLLICWCFVVLIS